MSEAEKINKIPDWVEAFEEKKLCAPTKSRILKTKRPLSRFMMGQKWYSPVMKDG